MMQLRTPTTTIITTPPKLNANTTQMSTTFTPVFKDIFQCETRVCSILLIRGSLFILLIVDFFEHYYFLIVKINVSLIIR